MSVAGARLRRLRSLSLRQLARRARARPFHVHLCRASVHGAPPPEVPADLELIHCPPGARSGWREIDRRSGPGRSCWAVLDGGGAVVHSTWVSAGSPLLAQLGAGRDAVLVGESYTAPSHRGRGLNPAVLLAILEHRRFDVRHRSDPYVYAMIDVDNALSLRSMGRAGFESVGTLEGATRLGRWQVARSDVQLRPPTEVSSAPGGPPS